MLKETFTTLLKKHTDNEALIVELWQEIVENHSEKERYYHTLNHLENILSQLTAVKQEIQNWDAILFTLYYHDVIYDAQKSDNEEKSAEFAENRMSKASIPVAIIQLCKTQILATKSHQTSSNPDTNYFTDADLSILGQSWEQYLLYCDNVRKEYSIYPDSLYNPGRTKVLSHFLEMERIFKTDFFHNKYEESAKMNIKKEIKQINN